jgi:hypothetical protein
VFPTTSHHSRERRPTVCAGWSGQGCWLGWAAGAGLVHNSFMNGVDRHRSHLCGWSSNHTDERESQGAGPRRHTTEDIRCPSFNEMSVRPLILFFHCKGFSVPFSIAKPTLGGTATPCRCPETHKKSEPSTQPLTQPRLTQPPNAAYLTQPPNAAT